MVSFKTVAFLLIPVFVAAQEGISLTGAETPTGLPMTDVPEASSAAASAASSAASSAAESVLSSKLAQSTASMSAAASMSATGSAAATSGAASHHNAQYAAALGLGGMIANFIL